MPVAANPVVSSALDALADLLDQIANDPTLDPTDRVANLRELRADLAALVGQADRYIGDQQLQREGDGLARIHEFMAARADANSREQLLDAGGVSPEALDAAGILSHDELDGRIADGTIEEAIIGLPHGPWDEGKHPRALMGRFASTGRIPEPKGRSGKVEGDLAKPAADLEKPLERGGTPEPSFKARARDLDTRVADAIARGHAEASAGAASPGTAAVRDTGPVADAAAGPNPAGKVSQKKLLAYARNALSQPATVDAYAHTHPDGTRTYSKTRQALHQKIIDSMLAGHKPQASPEVMFTGGGYGAGKGGIVKRLKAQGKLPKDHVLLDPDKIKAMIPEFQSMLKDGDPEANMAVYEEAWDIAKAVQAEAQKRKLNMVVDGLGNTSPEDMLGRVKSFRDAGYTKATAHYAVTDPEQAVATTMHRATKPSAKPEDRRFIPQELVRAAHRDVAASLPGIIAGSKEPGQGLDEVHVHDTSGSGAKDAQGNRPEPKALFSSVNGKETVHDQAGWDEALGRASDTNVAGAETPARADTDYALEEVQKLGLDKYPEQTPLASEVLNGAPDTQQMHAPAGGMASPGTAVNGVMYRGEGMGSGEPAGAASPGTTAPDLVTDPGVEYDASRKPVHDQIISSELGKTVGGLMGEDHPIAKKLAGGAVASDLSQDERDQVKKAAYDARGGQKPQFLFLAGGPASGKTTALNTAPELIPEHAVTLSPDEYMEHLPEYKKLREAGDVYAAGAGHEESTDISKRLQRESESLGLNLVADGVGNSKAATRDPDSGEITEHGKFAKKLIRANDAGYRTSALAVTVPTQVAQVRAVRRALGDGTNPGNGKLVPLPAVAQQHASVSENFPEIASLPFLHDVRVVDTSGNTPVTIAHGSAGNLEHDDPEAMREFLAKNPKSPEAAATAENEAEHASQQEA